MRGREVADPGIGSDRSDAADATRVPERRTHDYVRHGTTTLFAALDIATGKVTGLCQPRHRHQEFLRFLKQVARAYPTEELHLVMDNYAAHKRVEIEGLARREPEDPRALHPDLRRPG